jgi:hypothetical protein
VADQPLRQQPAGPAAGQADEEQGAFGRAAPAGAGGALVERVGDEAGDTGDQADGAGRQPGFTQKYVNPRAAFTSSAVCAATSRARRVPSFSTCIT